MSLWAVCVDTQNREKFHYYIYPTDNVIDFIAFLKEGSVKNLLIIVDTITKDIVFEEFHGGWGSRKRKEAYKAFLITFENK